MKKAPPVAVVRSSCSRPMLPPLELDRPRTARPRDKSGSDPDEKAYPFDARCDGESQVVFRGRRVLRV